MEIAPLPPIGVDRARGRLRGAVRTGSLVAVCALLLGGCAGEPASLKGLDELGVGVCIPTDRAGDWVAGVIPLSVPEGGRALTITAVDGDEGMPPGVSDARSEAEAMGDAVIVKGETFEPGPAGWALESLIDAEPEGWKARVQAPGYTIEPGETVHLVVPHSIRPGGLEPGETEEDSHGAVQTWHGIALTYRQGLYLTKTTNVDLSIAQAVGVNCSADPLNPGGFVAGDLLSSDGG